VHKVQIVDRQNGDDPHVMVSFDDKLVEAVCSYTVQGALGDVPRVTVTIAAEEVDISSGGKQLEKPF